MNILKIITGIVLFWGLEGNSQSTDNERNLLISLLANKKVADFISYRSERLCDTITLSDTVSKFSKGYYISDTILPLHFVHHIYKNIIGRDTTCLGQNYHVKQNELMDSTLLITNNHISIGENPVWIIYLTRKIGTVQPYIIVPLYDPGLPFVKVKLGEITYIFFDTKKTGVISVSGSRIIHN